MTADIDDHNLQLRRAVRNRDIQRVEAALRAGADPNFVPSCDLSDRLPSLHEAAYLGSLDIMDRLVAAGADVNLQGGTMETPLSFAARFNQAEAGHWLLRHGANQPDAVEPQYVPLTTALGNASLEFADMLLQTCPQMRRFHLNYAARIVIDRFDVKVAQWLLDKGVFTSLPSTGCIPWLHLVQSAKPDDALALTQMLLKAGADVNLADVMGATALHEAIKLRRPGTMMMLLHVGANPDLPDGQGKTVRALLQESTDEELRAAFIAWETSQSAHHIIQSMPVPHGLKLL